MGLHLLPVEQAADVAGMAGDDHGGDGGEAGDGPAVRGEGGDGERESDAGQGTDAGNFIYFI